MAIVHVIKLLVFVCCFMSKHGVATLEHDKCSVTWCRRGGTEIRFPFHRINHEKDKQLRSKYCGVPGFQLSCSTSDRSNNFPVLKFEYQVNTSLPGIHLSFSVEAYVDSIDYKSQQLHFFTKSNNITQHYGYYLPNSPFKHLKLREFPVDDPRYLTDYTFYRCSATISDIGTIDHIIEEVPSLSGHDYQVYVVYSHFRTVEALLTWCTKLYNVSRTPFFGGGLSWSWPNCRHCEGKDQYCKFKANSSTNTECFPVPKGPSSHRLLETGKVGGILVLSFMLVAFCYAIYLYKQKKNYQQKIEVFLEDYKALKPTRYSYADIKKISNHFKVKLGEGGYGSVFKGQLSNDVPVAVKILNDKADAKGSGADFINEVSTIGLIHHVNVVRLVGYCADGCRRALVYEFLPNNSLENYVYSKENRRNGFLGWQKMEEIALGIAKGIEYLHQGCAQRILHFDIKPHNILLDQNFNPKIADFGLAKLCSKGQSIVSMTMARGTVGYIAPEVFSRNFGKVSSKSDVYSFGMLLLEMVGARNHTLTETENTSEVYFPEWIFRQLEQETETRSQIEEDGKSKIERKLKIVGLCCVNWHPADRPSMKHVIQMLEAEDCPAMPPNPFSSTSSRNAFSAASARPFANELEVISESE
ncbi:rust resistance kinase Lr10 [Daucus carota subsp. sativus]|nr:PREDICTED: rust resistance kinase Lr10-like [Daucus carota subsp. sativus]XP_017215913.1 PREDICTED: rust resistance kinase Lr10-like [Daucus carota subsp. sativus]